MRTLDTLAQCPDSGLVGHRVDLAKIDVEGHEVAVLEGGLDTIERDRPDLFVEFLSEDSFEDFAALLPTGYVALAPSPDGSTRSLRDATDAVRVRDVLFRSQ